MEAEWVESGGARLESCKRMYHSLVSDAVETRGASSGNSVSVDGYTAYMCDETTQGVCTRASRMYREITYCLIISLQVENREKQKNNTKHNARHDPQPRAAVIILQSIGYCWQKGKRSRFDGAAGKTDQSLAHGQKRGCLTFRASSRTPPITVTSYLLACRHYHNESIGKLRKHVKKVLPCQAYKTRDTIKSF